jgi:hypothetical protein
MNAGVTWLRHTGATLLFAAIVSAIFVAPGLYRVEHWHISVLLIPGALAAIGGFTLFRARQYGARAVAANTFQPGVPTVLYLRPFKSDTSSAQFTIESALKMISEFATATALSELWTTEEEQLADAFSAIGSLVAIGKPGERLPLPGAARRYAGQDWQQIVTEMMQSAVLVVIKASTQPGVLWEIERARQVLPPHRLILLIGPEVSSRKSYEHFRMEAERLFRVQLPSWPLPKPPGRQRNALHGECRGFIRFTRTGIAEYVPLHAPREFQRGMRPLRRMYEYSLWPVHQELGIPWSPPRTMSGLTVVLLISGLIFVLPIVAIVLGVAIYSFVN